MSYFNNNRKEWGWRERGREEGREEELQYLVFGI